MGRREQGLEAKGIKAGEEEEALEEINGGSWLERGRTSERAAESQRESVCACSLLGERGRPGVVTAPLTIYEASYSPEGQHFQGPT